MREQIAKTKGEVLWTDLKAHIARDAVIIADGQLDLIDVGMAFATNDTKTVEAWIQDGKIQKPSPDELTYWSLTPNLTFTSIVVQPFVVIHRPVSPRPN